MMLRPNKPTSAENGTLNFPQKVHYIVPIDGPGWDTICYPLSTCLRRDWVTFYIKKKTGLRIVILARFYLLYSNLLGAPRIQGDIIL